MASSAAAVLKPAESRSQVLRLSRGGARCRVGTSPLYALRECFCTPGVAVKPRNLLDVLAHLLVLRLIVADKYLALRVWPSPPGS
jgi:K+ transporter